MTEQERKKIEKATAHLENIACILNDGIAKGFNDAAKAIEQLANLLKSEGINEDECDN